MTRAVVNVLPLVPTLDGMADTKPTGEPLSRLIELHRTHRLPELDESTRRSYAQTYGLLGSLGTHPSVARAGAWVTWLRQRYEPPPGASDSCTVHLHWKNARAMYCWAKEWGLVAGVNPFAVLNLSKPKPRARAILNLAELWPAILGACLDLRERALLTAARDLAARRSELCGLMPSDIITATTPWHVRIERQRKPSSWATKPLKTDRAVRTLPISEELRAMLVGLISEGAPQVWVGRGGQKLIESPFLFPYRSHELHDLRRRCGLVAPTAFPPGDWLHALRHTLAIYMMRSGASTDDVQRQLGHDSPATTQQVYAHFEARPASPKALRRALVAMAAGPVTWGAPPGGAGPPGAAPGGPEKRTAGVGAPAVQERSRQSHVAVNHVQEAACSTPSRRQSSSGQRRQRSSGASASAPREQTRGSKSPPLSGRQRSLPGLAVQAVSVRPERRRGAMPGTTAPSAGSGRAASRSRSASPARSRSCTGRRR